MSYYKSFDQVPGIFPYQPPAQPGPGTNPEHHEQPNQDPNTERTRITGKSKNTLDTVKEIGATQVPEVKSNIHCLTIVGQIEGHLVLPPQNKTTKYEHLIPQLVAIEQSPEIEGVLIILNTVGGDVEAGLAIAEMITSLSKPTVSVVLGGGHSIGVPIMSK